MDFKKFLCKLSGEDYSIIQSDSGLKNHFSKIGLFVLAIFSLCFISSYLIFTMLFQNFIAGILISIFFSLMIINIYLLLLYTLTKNILPHKKNTKAVIFSVGVRIVFICFIAVIVSKPLEVMVFSSSLKNDIELYKQEQIKKYTAISLEYLSDETKNIKLIIENSEKTGKPAIVELNRYKKNEIRIADLNSKMIALVQSSDYYIQGIKILCIKYPICWFITFISIIVFIAPAFLKNILGEKSIYYDMKRAVELVLIEEDYSVFKKRYSLNFKEKYQVDKTFCEPFIDAPFNTIRKKDEREFLKEDDLIAELYNA